MVCSLPKNLSPHFGLLVFLLLFLHCQAMVLYGEDIELATRFARIAESLINGHPQEHTLLAKLTYVISSTTVLVEPFQAVMDRFLKAFNSSIIAGDFDNAVMLSVLHCLVCIFVVPNLENTPRILAYFVSQNLSANVYICYSPNARNVCSRNGTAHMRVFGDKFQCAQCQSPCAHC